MRRPPNKSHRNFAWQALLILMPLLGLASFGVLSLQQDRRLARHAAVERAQAIADALLPRLWNEVQQASADGGVRFSVDAAGNLAWPRPVLGLDDLSSYTGGESEGAKVFRAGLRHLKDAEIRDAARAFSQVALQYPEHRGETGLPLGPLAEMKLIEIQEESSIDLGVEKIAFDSFCSNTVSRPTMLTSMLLERAETLAVSSAQKAELAKWNDTWQKDELARELFNAAQENPGNLRSAPPISAIGDRAFLLRSQKEDTNEWFAVITSAELSSRLEPVIKDQKGVPDYLSCNVYVGGILAAGQGIPHGISIGESRGRPGFVETLASAVKTESGAQLLEVNVLLADPAGLYRQQRIRTWWFGMFIALSSAVAIFALAGAWRSFRQQERLNEMKSNFVSSVSHELRAPIASVRLMAENLERGKVPDESRRMEYFRFISQECRRLSSLIENVLDFSRIEQGRKQYEFEVCDLTEVVRSTVRLMQPVAAEKGITLVQFFPAGLAPSVSSIPADGKALQQALVNLVDNALKHSPRGSTVTIGIEPAPGNKHVLLWVEDQGEGIPEAEHERIFERFYRLGSELRRETQGVGIGLSIVKHIVDAHRGRIHVRSAPGQGSRFTIELKVGSSRRDDRDTDPTTTREDMKGTAIE